MLKTMKRTLSITAIAATAALVTACGGSDFDGTYQQEGSGISIVIDGKSLVASRGEDSHSLEAAKLVFGEDENGNPTMKMINDKGRAEEEITKLPAGSIKVKGQGEYAPVD